MQDIDQNLLKIFKEINLDNKLLDPNGAIGKQFYQIGINTLYAAINHVYGLKYQPPSDPFNWNLVISEQCGTCSTRHALLVLLAKENNVSFALGHAIYHLTPERFPMLQPILERSGLPFIPESHNFIVYNHYFLDITFPGHAQILPQKDVSLMKTIDCAELLYVKKTWYPVFLKQWLKQYSNMTLEQYAELHREIVQLLG